MQAQHFKGIKGNKTFGRKIVGRHVGEIPGDPETEDGGGQALSAVCTKPGSGTGSLEHKDFK